MPIPSEKQVRTNPAYYIIGFIALVAGGVLAGQDYLDKRYSKADDVRALATDVKAQGVKTDVGFLGLRRATLRDKIIELEAKQTSGKLMKWEVSQLLRYKAELADVEQEIRAKQR